MNKKNYYKAIIDKIASDTTSNPVPSIKGYENRIRKITECGNNKTLMTISYVDKKGNRTNSCTSSSNSKINWGQSHYWGNRTKRLVEPYKLTDTDFWGYDIAKNEIRRFKTQNIKGVKKSIKTFEPRWDIEMNN